MWSPQVRLISTERGDGERSGVTEQDRPVTCLQIQSDSWKQSCRNVAHQRRDNAANTLGPVVTTLQGDTTFFALLEKQQGVTPSVKSARTLHLIITKGTWHRTNGLGFYRVHLNTPLLTYEKLGASHY
ncbi:hypothetical protein J6590_008836 [Homalodisca vitripennis]|nr:hypothetical protein J6590_008836 [Homalodisca vitripennis]